ncbi:hypothetical protein H9X96_10260 [Pedobacter sp. N36a]|uniref:DUF6850 family outer membrane beta-barrel protein n=1 Tax=Pedobacter sp. N36a TaxID=2767996 RepID=UPI001656E503|nr:DUF6850 family outer membrane beta-barrel protein [Pedobacter sp. N36a]MBC8986156.1 hypothetical protein [Pedobacter sp. N36a]
MLKQLKVFIVIMVAGIGFSHASDTAKLDSLGLDSLMLRQKLKEYHAPLTRFTDGFYTNPAMKYYSRNSSLTELSLGYTADKQGRYEMQQGKGGQRFGFDTEALLKHKDKDVLWGSAAYSNGKRKNVLWNESSDYAIIAPYVMADTVGGDLSYEQYSFSGGYGIQLGKTMLGISGKYRALLEYRDIDPRPKNVVSDLEFELGAARALNQKYHLAIGLSARKYTQENIIKFYNQLGSPVVYHMTGLGTDNKLFAGNRTESYYNGGGYGFQLQLAPKDKIGLFSTLEYRDFSFDKTIRIVLEALPMAELKSKLWKGELAYLLGDQERQYGLKIAARNEQRSGIESKFDNRGQGSYVKIASSKNYLNEQSEFRLTGIYNVQKQKTMSWQVLADIGYTAERTEYADPARSMDFRAISGGINLGLTSVLGKSLLQAAVAGKISKNTDATRSWSDLNASSAVYRMLESNYAYHVSDYQQLNLSARWDYPLKNGMGISLKSVYSYTAFDTKYTGNQFLLTGGITF